MATIASIKEIPLEKPYEKPSRMWEVKVRNGRRVGTFHLPSGVLRPTWDTSDYTEAGLLNLLHDYADDRHIRPEDDDEYGLPPQDLKVMKRNGQRIYDELERIGL